MDNCTACNIVLAIGGQNGFVSTEVQISTSVLRLKFSANNPAHRQYAAVRIGLRFQKPALCYAVGFVGSRSCPDRRPAIRITRERMATVYLCGPVENP